ncbi:hypothetical protein BDZ89DRAFT_776938 [Hymenopellis radicata]|nr:hypothetical protein BDZ89DRAFT_776938 [Hymenopellis radicata]
MTDAASTEQRPTNSFRTFIENQLQAIDADADADDDVDDVPNFTTDIIGNKLTLEEMFDFTNEYWFERFKKIAQISFDEECAVYELMNFDGAADSDPEVDVDVDGMLEDIVFA